MTDLAQGAVVYAQRINEFAVVPEAARQLLGGVAAKGLLHDGYFDGASKHRHQAFVAAGLRQHAVELAVEPAHSRRVLEADIAAPCFYFVLQGEQRGDILLADVARCMPGDLTFYQHPQVEYFTHLARRPMANHRAAVGFEYRKTVGHQQPHCFTHGCA